MKGLTGFRLAGWLLAIALLGGCGTGSSDKKSSSNDGSLGEEDYTVLENDGLTLSDDSVEGSGKIAFVDPIGEIGAKKHYTISFQLEESGSVALITHGDDKLSDGIEVYFRREGGEVKMKMVHGNDSSEEATLAGLSGATGLSIGVDVHNDETPAHILIWNGDDFSEEAAIFNSEEDGDAPGNGKASFWGIALAKATLSSSAIGEAKFSEEE